MLFWWRVKNNRHIGAVPVTYKGSAGSKSQADVEGRINYLTIPMKGGGWCEMPTYVHMAASTITKCFDIGSRPIMCLSWSRASAYFAKMKTLLEDFCTQLIQKFLPKLN